MNDDDTICTCPNDGEHCPHCGHALITVRPGHVARCHRAAVGTG